MELQTIEMPQEQAKQAFLEYRQAVRSAKTATLNSEDAQIARCYKALAEGHQVINIMDAFEQAGEDDRGLPRLAIARADDERISMYRNWSDGRVEMGSQYLFPIWSRRSGAAYRTELFSFKTSVRSPTIKDRNGRAVSNFTAIVPNIPPALRPPHSLQNYHLLWEPKWDATPPKDPALLKHLDGPLYAVLATWDLTPIEQAVLGVTRNLAKGE